MKLSGVLIKVTAEQQCKVELKKMNAYRKPPQKAPCNFLRK